MMPSFDNRVPTRYIYDDRIYKMMHVDPALCRNIVCADSLFIRGNPRLLMTLIRALLWCVHIFIAMKVYFSDI